MKLHLGVLLKDQHSEKINDDKKVLSYLQCSTRYYHTRVRVR